MVRDLDVHVPLAWLFLDVDFVACEDSLEGRLFACSHNVLLFRRIQIDEILQNLAVRYALWEDKLDTTFCLLYFHLFHRHDFSLFQLVGTTPNRFPFDER